MLTEAPNNCFVMATVQLVGGGEAVALRKLDMVDAATRLDDLLSPPGNRLEALRGDRRGLHSIRINRQWRICFRWTPDGPEAVEILDYH